MRTRTIFEALRSSEYKMRNRHFAHRERFYLPDREERRKAAQSATFERELLRRIEERDAGSWRSISTAKPVINELCLVATEDGRAEVFTWFGDKDGFLRTDENDIAPYENDVAYWRGLTFPGGSA